MTKASGAWFWNKGRWSGFVAIGWRALLGVDARWLGCGDTLEYTGAPWR